MRISNLVKFNIIATIILIIIAFNYQIFIEKFVYARKASEAISVTNLIAKAENDYYLEHNRYKEVPDSSNEAISRAFNLDKRDLIYYNYNVIVGEDRYSIEAVPKIEYLKAKTIKPSIYFYRKELNRKEKKGWK